MSHARIGKIDFYGLPDRVEIQFEYDQTLVQFCKDLGARWDRPRRAWVVSIEERDGAFFDFIRSVEKKFEATAPEGWTEVVKGLSQHPCVSGVYSFEASIAGIMFTLPPNDVLFRYISEMEGVQRLPDLRLFLPCGACAKRGLSKVVSEVANQDREAFLEASSPLKRPWKFDVEGERAVYVLERAKEQQTKVLTGTAGFFRATDQFYPLTTPYAAELLSAKGERVQMRYLSPDNAYEAVKKQAVSGSEYPLKDV